MRTVTAQARQRNHREIWNAKPVLREVYGHLYRRMQAACAPGRTLEVGGGSGNFKSQVPDVLSFDIVPAPWLDLVADAQSLPLRSGSIGNLVLLDVLHHIEYPLRFLSEAARVLEPGGRIVMVEPGITPLSGVVYRLLHEEPVIMAVDPFIQGTPNPGKDPYIGNQAIPTLLFTREAKRLSRLLPELSVERVEWLSLLAYPLSGGFQSWRLLTPALARIVLRMEDLLLPWIGEFCAFRLMIVLEKRRNVGSRSTS